ncbi:hypothetical protein MWU61_03805 [Loktanella sp. F6476L]|uniref:hypothetical protein n=1 Tax=Loktanella sp. F6476L TaxID=2926405 RepID=UPI001FF57A55|nr:hypothetical protein [Loktanella sp. F6476L]MCK0119649.1 hypothetical protein [Loktanella sp. F6476L]
MLQANMAAGYAAQATQPTSITSQQAEKLTTFLADFDSSKLTESDTKKIVTQIKEIGIRPGSGLESLLSDNGIDAKDLANQAGIKGGDRPPPPPPEGGQAGSQSKGSVDAGIVALIADAVEAFAVADDAETVWSLLQPTLEEAGYDTSQQMIDVYL